MGYDLLTGSHPAAADLPCCLRQTATGRGGLLTLLFFLLLMVTLCDGRTMGPHAMRTRSKTSGESVLMPYQGRLHFSTLLVFVSHGWPTFSVRCLMDTVYHWFIWHVTAAMRHRTMISGHGKASIKTVMRSRMH